MIAAPSTLAEFHTSDLAEPCQRKVLLTHQGRAVGSMPSALYRGNLLHHALRTCHSRGEWTPEAIGGSVVDAAAAVALEATRENRPITPAVVASYSDHWAEAERIVRAYGQRVAPLFPKVIATEAPIRLTLDVDGEPAEFASHIDLLSRDDKGRLCIPDFKSQADAPTRAYLNRNLQFGLYWLACKYGSIQLDEWSGWQTLDEWPRMAWVHLNHLLPYGRKTTVNDYETGESTTYEKGQARPLDKVVLWADYVPDCEDVVRARLADFVRMRRHGLYPMSPDPLGCHLCECRDVCDSWTFKGGAE